MRRKLYLHLAAGEPRGQRQIGFARLVVLEISCFDKHYALSVAGRFANHKSESDWEESMGFWARSIALTAALVLTADAAAADDYPSKAVKIIVPFSAGGPADVYARFVGNYLSEALKQSFVIEDRPGAGAVIGTETIAKSEPPVLDRKSVV